MMVKEKTLALEHAKKAGEGEEVRSGRILLEDCSTQGLDPGRLDAVGDSAG